MLYYTTVPPTREGQEQFGSEHESNSLASANEIKHMTSTTFELCLLLVHDKAGRAKKKTPFLHCLTIYKHILYDVQIN